MKKNWFLFLLLLAGCQLEDREPYEVVPAPQYESDFLFVERLPSIPGKQQNRIIWPGISDGPVTLERIFKTDQGEMLLSRKKLGTFSSSHYYTDDDFDEKDLLVKASDNFQRRGRVSKGNKVIVEYVLTEGAEEKTFLDGAKFSVDLSTDCLIDQDAEWNDMEGCTRLILKDGVKLVVSSISVKELIVLGKATIEIKNRGSVWNSVERFQGQLDLHVASDVSLTVAYAEPGSMVVPEIKLGAGGKSPKVYLAIGENSYLYLDGKLVGKNLPGVYFSRGKLTVVNRDGSFLALGDHYYHYGGTQSLWAKKEDPDLNLETPRNYFAFEECEWNELTRVLRCLDAKNSLVVAKRLSQSEILELQLSSRDRLALEVFSLTQELDTSLASSGFSAHFKYHSDLGFSEKQVELLKLLVKDPKPLIGLMRYHKIGKVTFSCRKGSVIGNDGFVGLLIPSDFKGTAALSFDELIKFSKPGSAIPKFSPIFRD